MGYPKQMFKEFRSKLVKNETQEKMAIEEGWITSPSGTSESYVTPKAPIKKAVKKVARKKVARKK